MRLSVPPAFRYPRFLFFWLGIALAWTGLQVQLWTAFWYVRTLTDAPAALGTAALARFIPLLFFSLAAGVVADMFSRRKIMLITQGCMGLVSLLFGITLLNGELSIARIYLLLGLQATAFAFDLPARQSLVPNLVPAAVLRNALSLQVISFQAGALLGPNLSGLIINRWGEQTAFMFSAALFALFILVLFGIGSIPQQKLGAGRPRAAITNAVDGIRFTFREPLILSSMILDFLATFFTRADALMPIFARDILGLGPIGYGMLSSAQAIGAITAGLTFSLVRVIYNQGRVLLLSVAMIGVGALIFGLSRNFYLSMFALILIGASDAVSAIIRNTIRQLHTPDLLRGRMVSVNQVFFVGGPQLGDWKSGLLGGLFGVPAAIAAGGMACILSVGWVARRWPQLANYNQSEAVPTAAD